MSTSAVTALATVTSRLAHVEPKHLPKTVHELARTIVDCRPILSAPHDALKKDSRGGMLVHKFITQINALLNDRTTQGRLVGIVLAKTAIDVGQWQLVKDAGSWLRALLSILGKIDHPSTKKLAVLTIAKIFLLSHEYPTLERELAKPNLPSFVAVCLDLLSQDGAKSSRMPQHPASKRLLSEPIFQSFRLLLAVYPTVFRPFQIRIQQEVLRALSSETGSLPSIAVDAATHLWPALIGSTPPTKQDEAWQKDIQSIVHDVHKTCDHVFRAVHEVWKSSCGIFASDVPTNEMLTSSKDVRVGFAPWTGINAGCRRLCELLSLLTSYVQSALLANVTTSLGLLVDVMSRLSQVTAPSQASRKAELPDLKMNDQVGKDEREALFSELPHVHAATFRVMHTMLKRYGSAVLGLYNDLEDQVIFVFEHEHHNTQLRYSAFETLSYLIQRSGRSQTKQSISRFDRIIKQACQDLLASRHTKEPSTNGTDALSGINADTILKDPSTSNGQQLMTQMTCSDSALMLAAEKLLIVYVSQTPSQYIRSSARNLIDRALTLSKSKNGVIASTLNPAVASIGSKSQSSLLPILVHDHVDRFAVEAILRPRMPPIVPIQGNTDASQDQASRGRESGDQVDEDDGLVYIERSASDEPMEDSLNDPQPAEQSGVSLDNMGDQTSAYQALKRPADSLATGEEKKVRTIAAASSGGGIDIVYAQPLAPELSTMPIVADAKSQAAIVGQSGDKDAAIDNIGGTQGQLSGGMHDDDDDSDFEIPELVLASDEEEEDDVDDQNDNPGS